MSIETPNLKIPKLTDTDVFNTTNLGKMMDAIDQNAAKQTDVTKQGNDLNTHSADDVSHNRYGTDTGTANAKVVTLSPAPTSLVAGFSLRFKNNLANTGAVTLNVNTLGAKTVLRQNGNAAVSGTLKAGLIYTVVYDGTSFILQGEGASGNAIASDLLSGKTASTDAGDIVGTMADRGAMTITPGTTNQTIPAGRHNGSGVVLGDPDLISANILQGKDIFGVIGTVKAGDYKISDNILMENLQKIKDNGLNSAYTDISVNNVHNAFTYNGYIYAFVDYYYLKKYTSSGVLVWTKQITNSTSGTTWKYDESSWYIENGKLYFLVGCDFSDYAIVKTFDFTTEVITQLSTSTPGVSTGTQTSPNYANVIGFYVSGNTIYLMWQYSSGGNYSLYFTRNTMSGNTAPFTYNTGSSYSSPYRETGSTKRPKSHFYKLGTKYYVFMYQGGNGKIWEIDVVNGYGVTYPQETAVNHVLDVMPDGSGIFGYNPTTNVVTFFNSASVAGATFNAPTTFSKVRGHYPLLNDFAWYDGSTSGTYKVYLTTNRLATPGMFSLVTPNLAGEITVPTSDNKIHRLSIYDSTTGKIKGYTMDKETYQILA